MRHTILQLAMTIDGYIARSDGSVDFLGEMNDEDTISWFNDFVSTIDVIVMGRATYDQMLSFGDVPFPNKRIIVLTTRPLSKTYTNIETHNIDITELFNQLEGTIWLFGGATVIQDAMNAELVDEMQLFVVPTVLGKGIPLFNDVQESDNWTLIETKEFDNNVLINYKKTTNA